MIGTDIHAWMGTMPHTVFSLYLGPPNYMSRDSPLTLMPTVPYASEEAVQPLSHMYCYQTGVKLEPAPNRSRLSISVSCQNLYSLKAGTLTECLSHEYVVQKNFQIL